MDIFFALRGKPLVNPHSGESEPDSTIRVENRQFSDPDSGPIGSRGEGSHLAF
jgi:hypothetical protein